MLFKKSDTTRSIKWRLIGIVGKRLIDLIFFFSNIQVRGREPIAPILASRKFVLAFWHARILLVSHAFRGWHAPILVSDSADGEIIARILQRQGQITVRGSTRKGGMRAMGQMIRLMRTHQSPGGMVPDGPQGPRHKVQPGVIYLAQKTGYPIIPVTYSAKRRWVANSWDRFIIPCPTSPCLLLFGRPIRVPSGGMDQIQSSVHELEQELMRITTEADRHWGHAIVP